MNKPCDYCGQIVDPSNWRRHLDTCLMNPDVSERVKSFMQEHAVDGVALTVAEYKVLSKGKASAYSMIQRHFASWFDFCEWCELKSPTPKYKRNSEYNCRAYVDPWAPIMERIDAEIEHNRKHERDAYDFRAIAAIDRGVKRLYDPRRMTYYTAHVMELK